MRNCRLGMRLTLRILVACRRHSAWHRRRQVGVDSDRQQYRLGVCSGCLGSGSRRRDVAGACDEPTLRRLARAWWRPVHVQQRRCEPNDGPELEVRLGSGGFVVGEVHQYCFHSPVNRGLFVQAELREQRVDVLLDGSFREHQRLGNAGVVLALRDFGQHIEFARA